MKSLLLQTSILLLSASSFAQLYVKPPTTGGTESYIFVKDQILFVNQDIGLTANTASTDYKASIYLRNQAQLIQGNVATANTGTGAISVIQNTPETDGWDYTYWGSPVGVPDAIAGNRNFGLLHINDSLTLTRSTAAVADVTFDGYTHAVGSVNPPLTISTRWIHTKPNGGPYLRMNATEGILPGQGFTMKGVSINGLPGNHNQKYDFRGRPNNGNVTATIVADKLTLTGNPYPSALDLNRFFYDNAPRIEQILYWDSDRTRNTHLHRETVGGYGTWVPGTMNPNGTNPGSYAPAVFQNYNNDGTPIPGTVGNGADLIRRFAPIGQGFMLYNEFAGGTVTFTNSQRRYIKEGAINNSQFRGPISVGGGISINPIPFEDTRTPSLRIQTSFNDEYTREMVLNFSEGSTEGYDLGLDGRHPEGVANDVYFPIVRNNVSVPYVISDAPFEDGGKYPLTFRLQNRMELVLKVVDIVNMPVPKAFLWDSELNLIYPITHDEKATLSLQAGTYADRFFIIFTEDRETLGTSEADIYASRTQASVNFFQNNTIGQLEISNPESYSIKNASMYDMTGKLVISQNNLGNASTMSLNTSSLSDAIYLVKLTTTDNVVIDYKAIVYNKK